MRVSSFIKWLYLPRQECALPGVQSCRNVYRMIESYKLFNKNVLHFCIVENTDYRGVSDGAQAFAETLKE